MSQPEFRRPTGSDDTGPYDPPGYTDQGTGTPGSDIRPHTEVHHATTPDDRGRWNVSAEDGPPDWLVEGTFVPGHEPAWEGTSRRPAPASRRRWRLSGRMIAATILLMAAIGAATVVTFPRDRVIRHLPTDNPGARANQSGLGVQTGHRRGGGGGRSPGAQPPAITKAQAEQVLSAYWRTKNEANELRSDSLLATIEAGTSYSMDIGAYRFDRVADPSNHDYVAIALVRAAFYIPRLAAGEYPRWFVAAVTYAGLASPRRPTGARYLLFSQAFPGGPWKDVLEPHVLPGTGPAPRIATDAEGYAAAVSPIGDAGGLSVVPGQFGSLTAASLDGGDTAAIKPPGNVADLRDEAFWRSHLPAGSTEADRHQAGPGPVFGLRTVDGGAVLFYSVTAQLFLAASTGETFQLDIPGYYSPSQAVPSARVGYLEQFAAYDPPWGQAVPYVVADVSSIASRG
jgi:hypothetical protein